MPYDDTNTLTINAVAQDKRTERGPVLRGEVNIDVQALERAGWDGQTPLRVSLWLREGVSRNGVEYRFWSGPVEVDEYRQERADNRSAGRRREDDREPAVRPGPARSESFDDDIPF